MRLLLARAAPAIAPRSSPPASRRAISPCTVLEARGWVVDVAGTGEEALPLPPSPMADPTPATPPGPTHEVGVLRFASLSPAGQPVSVPVLAGPGLDERWLRSQPSFVPGPVQQQLEGLGYTVERQRRLISVQMDDAGRYLSIPVDEVQLRPHDESI